MYRIIRERHSTIARIVENHSTKIRKAPFLRKIVALFFYKCYNSIMEDIKQNVAKNLQELRKMNNLTQAELAEKLNYSDKSVSKWEHAESLPDIEVLCRLAEMYGVTVDFLTKEGSYKQKAEYVKKDNSLVNRIAIIGLIVSAVWLIAAIIYIYILLFVGYSAWVAFIWALPASAFITLYMLRKWGIKKYSYLLSSIFLWSLLLSLCFQFIQLAIWPILLIGVPIQVAIVLISKIKK